jgi:hypothetical protein
MFIYSAILAGKVVIRNMKIAATKWFYDIPQ